MTNAEKKLRELYNLLESRWDFKITEQEDEKYSGKALVLEKCITDEVLDISSDLLQNICHVFETEEYEISVVHPQGKIFIKFRNINTGVDQE